MSDLAACAECGTRYDPAVHPFCPRCGSTARGAPVPAALVSARRNDPGRRRVQASGALLLIVGLLFLVSTAVSLAVPVGEMARQFVEPMAGQPGGTLVLVPPDAAPFNVTLRSVDGMVLANATGHAGEYRYASPDHASLRYTAAAANGATNGTAIVLPGDTLRVPLDGEDHRLPQVSGKLRTTVEAGRFVFLGLALVLAGGGASAAFLRLWPLAATAAAVGLLLAALVTVGFLLAGLLFAIPFGAAAYFILRGRRHFAKQP